MAKSNRFFFWQIFLALIAVAGVAIAMAGAYGAKSEIMQQAGVWITVAAGVAYWALRFWGMRQDRRDQGRGEGRDDEA